MIPGSANPLLLKSAAAAAGGYQVSRSLRFNSSDSGFCARTPAVAGNRRTWTWAGWVKRSALGAEQVIFSCMANDVSFYTSLTFEVNDKIYIYESLTANGRALVTTQLFRDPSAWFHILLHYNTTDATNSNKAKLYINGIEVTQFDEDNRSYLTSDASVNRAAEHNIGKRNYSPAPQYLSGCLADIYFIDGQALTPSSFTEVSATTGQLIPKAYTGGSYGTNGFYLQFADNSSNTAATLGKDTSGNSNNWTPNNLSVTAGAGNDSLVDTPTSYGTDTGVGGEVRGNYATLNPLDNATTLTDGNLNTNNSAGNDKGCRGTIGITSGKWYWEVTNVTAGSAGANASQIGISTSGGSLTSYVGSHAGGYAVDTQNGNKFNNASSSSYLSGASAANAVHGIAFDADNRTLTIYRNGSTPGTAFSSIPTGIYFPAISNYAANCIANFGQRAFAYTAPSGFKALCDTNLPAPLTAKPSTVFDVITYTGTGSSLTLPNGSSTPTSISFTPDFAWLKGRSGATDHALYDAVRGVQKDLVSNSNAAETTQTTGLTAFGTNTFTVGSLAKLNTSSSTYVAWAWNAGGTTVTNTAGSITSQVRANPSAGFSVITYTGSGTTATVGHGLGVAPSLIICKSTSAVDWAVYHVSTGRNGFLLLNSTAAFAGYSGYWGNSNPSSTVISFDSVGYGGNNASGFNYVAYCFAPVVGYSSFGSYTGNGSADGPFVYTGMRPRWVMIKRSDSTSNWFLVDTARDTSNVSGFPLFPNDPASEVDIRSNTPLDILSNGFKLRTSTLTGGTNINISSATYIYAAFAENPFQYARAR